MYPVLCRQRSSATADRLAPGGTQNELRDGKAARRSRRRPQYRKRAWPATLSLSGRRHGAVPDRSWRRRQPLARQRRRTGVFRGVADRSRSFEDAHRAGCRSRPDQSHNGSSAFHSAAEVRPGDVLVADHLETIHILKEAGLDPNRPAGVGVQSDWGPVYQGDSPLHMAAQLNRPEVIEALIAAGCSRSQANVAHETPRETALRVGRGEDIVRLL
ncbi:MAG: ankyrin repeat domain-containing protein [Gemmatimonadetes bacterium]|nr:ankyrin repeat domain-containing protein [Gemmatimonadota bacterium]